MNAGSYAADEVGAHDEDVGGGAEALGRSKIANALVVELLARHHLEDVERGPAHVVPDHLQLHVNTPSISLLMLIHHTYICKLCDGHCLDVDNFLAQLLAAFVHAGRDELGLEKLATRAPHFIGAHLVVGVRSDAADEVLQRALEHLVFLQRTFVSAEISQSIIGASRMYASTVHSATVGHLRLRGSAHGASATAREPTVQKRRRKGRLGHFPHLEHVRRPCRLTRKMLRPESCR